MRHRSTKHSIGITRVRDRERAREFNPGHKHRHPTPQKARTGTLCDLAHIMDAPVSGSLVVMARGRSNE
jgi:hypothetical protein